MEWHARYLQQARWTESLRAYLFGKVGLAAADRVLEVGCGTGAVLVDFPLKQGVFGLDISLPSIREAARNAPDSLLVAGNGLFLPYPEAVFDVVFCHFLLLWTTNPEQVVAEMCRVTRKGGVVLALAEPDYGGRIDYPTELSELGSWQVQSLRKQGAVPEMGRRLAGIFNRAGLKKVETGVIGGEWKRDTLAAEPDLEWQVLVEDLSGMLSPQQIRKLGYQDRDAWKQGERVLYVPTFYAWGMV